VLCLEVLCFFKTLHYCEKIVGLEDHGENYKAIKGIGEQAGMYARPFILASNMLAETGNSRSGLEHS
jgi:hypothetical protein